MTPDEEKWERWQSPPTGACFLCGGKEGLYAVVVENDNTNEKRSAMVCKSHDRRPFYWYDCPRCGFGCWSQDPMECINHLGTVMILADPQPEQDE